MAAGLGEGPIDGRGRGRVGGYVCSLIVSLSCLANGWLAEGWIESNRIGSFRRTVGVSRATRMGRRKGGAGAAAAKGKSREGAARLQVGGSLGLVGAEWLSLQLRIQVWSHERGIVRYWSGRRVTAERRSGLIEGKPAAKAEKGGAQSRRPSFRRFSSKQFGFDHSSTRHSPYIFIDIDCLGNRSLTKDVDKDSRFLCDFWFGKQQRKALVRWC